jgi:hypothetical protein
MFISFFQFDIELAGEEIINTLLNPYLLGSVILGIIILIVLVKLFLMFFKKYYKTPSTFEQVHLLVLVPKVAPDSKQAPREVTLQKIQEDIGIMESFFSAVGGLKAQRGFKTKLLDRTDNISFEIVAHKDEIAFYVIVPKYLRNYIEQQIQSQFPHAYIEEQEDYNIFLPKGHVEMAQLVYFRQSFLPIKTYKHLSSDPLNSLTNNLSKIDVHDGAAIQFVVRSAYAQWHQKGPKVASQMKQGKSFKKAIAEINKGALSKIFEGIGKFFKSIGGGEDKNKLEKPEKHYTLSPMEEEMAKAMEEKSSKAGMEVTIRVVASSDIKAKAKAYVENISNAFTQFNNYEYGNSFKVLKLKSTDKNVHDFIYRRFSKKHCLLNSEEMASLFHFPLPYTETPKIKWLFAKKAPPPVNIPQEGILLGYNDYRGKITQVRLKREDRMRHAYFIGMTGTGKTNIIQSMFLQDVENGDGCCYIDPHGDAIEFLLSNIPKERYEDVIVFDPSEIERPMGLNLLEYKTEQEKTFVINEMIEIFDRLYDLSKTGGPMFEQYMRNAMLLVMGDPSSGSTLLEIPRVLADATFRRYKLKKCPNKVVVDFWIKEAEKAGGEAALANIVTYITSKLAPFLTNAYLKPIISQQQSTLDFENIMNNQKILLVSISKGKIGEMNMKLLGMIIVGKILVSTFSRIGLSDRERKDFFLYIDEFQNFVTKSIEQILSEARKYRLSLNIAHQYIKQLSPGGDETIKNAVFGNVGTRACFRIDAEDAEVMAKQFSPVFNEFDLINIPKYNCYIKLLIDNQNPPAFNMGTYPPRIGDPRIAAGIKNVSKLKYGRDYRMVESEINDRIKRTDFLASTM